MEEEVVTGCITMQVGDKKFLVGGEEEVKSEGETAPRYTIRSVGDMFISVRRESLPKFLTDLAILFEHHYRLTELGLVEKASLQEFVWVDDGKQRCSTNVTIQGGTEEENEELAALMAAKFPLVAKKL
jgi:hypothetical protein